MPKYRIRYTKTTVPTKEDPRGLTAEMQTAEADEYETAKTIVEERVRKEPGVIGYKFKSISVL